MAVPSVPRQAVIVGGGIAGLACAIGLARGGWRCTVLERAPKRRGQGHRVRLPPSGRSALEALGAGPIEPFRAPIDAFAVCAPDGTAQRQFAIPGCLSLLHRDLLAGLMRALPEAVERRTEHCVGLEGNPADGYRVVGATGQRWQGQLIVAADGVGSLCRGALFPGARLTEELVSELGLVVRHGPLARPLGRCCRKFQHPEAGLALGLVPCRDDQVVVYAQIATHRHPLPSPAGTLPALGRLFSGWNGEIQALLETLTPSTAVHLWRTTDLDPLPALHWGPVVLVGDSGHPMLPFASQGAAAALEDALLLSSLLERANPLSLNEALGRYSASRLPAVTRLLLRGRELRRQFLDSAAVEWLAGPPMAGFPTTHEEEP